MIEAEPVPNFVRQQRLQVVRTRRSRQRRGRGVRSLAVVAESVSASRIWPAKVAAPLAPTETPGALAVITRVNASTPLENPMLDWLKQIVLSPSKLLSASFVQEFAALTCPSGASIPGWFVALNVVPVTPDHAPNESAIACSISVSCAGVPDAAAVRTVTGAEGSEVLQRRLRGDASERFQRSNDGHPPACGIVLSIR